MLEPGENYLEPKEPFAWEYFSDNSAGWPLEERAEVRTYIEDGMFMMDQKQPEGSWMVNKDVDIDQTRNFDIKARFIKTGGVDDKGYGLAWGMKDNQNLSLFMVTGNKYYTISRFEKGNYNTVVDWKESDRLHIHVTGVSYNELTIRKIGNTLHWIVNGSELHQGKYEGYYGNNIGIVVAGTQVVGVDYLIVNYLE
jgi:hypothetical protein